MTFQLYATASSTGTLPSTRVLEPWCQVTCAVDALRDRRLLTIDDDCVIAAGSRPAVPAKPRAPYSERPVAGARRAKARELVERLVTEGRK